MLEKSIFTLNAEEIKQMIFLSNQFTENENPSKYPESFCRKSRECSLQIPKKILDHFFQIYENGYILFRNFPVDYLGETPEKNTERVAEKTQLAKIQGILLHVLGEMIAFEAEGDGHLFQDIVPVKEMETLQTSIGSNKELEIHTEQAFSELRPDFLSLACVRGDPEAFTYILPVSQIIDNILEQEKSILWQSLWKTGVDLSFKLLGQEFLKGDIRGPLAILNGTQANPFLIFDQDLMTGITEKAQAKISEIVDIYYKHRIAYCLQPGDILIIDNRKVVHGRSPFSPKYDGKDRFLIRAFGYTVKKYSRSKYARNGGRMILAKYS
jgi:L-asparagine oxygenase